MTANKTMKWMKRIKKKVNTIKRADSTEVESARFSCLRYVFFYLFYSFAQKHLFLTITGAIKLFFQHVFLFSLAEADTFGSIVLFAPLVHHDFRVLRLHRGPERESGLHS